MAIERECSTAEFPPVELIDFASLLRVHSEKYLSSIESGQLSPDELYRLGLPWSPNLLRRCWLETSATVLAANAARIDHVACNLGGGTHHAFPERGLGYCVLNDVAVAIHELRVTTPLRRFMVIDTDAHHGNGTAAIFANDPDVFTYSIHGGRNYPIEKPPSTLDVPLPRQVEGVDYLKALTESLPGAIDSFQPELIFWNSGADCHVDDLFGQMRLSTAQMRERDRLVLGWIRATPAKLVVLYGGGYNKTPGFTARLHTQTILATAAAYVGLPKPDIELL